VIDDFKRSSEIQNVCLMDNETVVTWWKKGHQNF